MDQPLTRSHPATIAKEPYAMARSNSVGGRSSWTATATQATMRTPSEHPSPSDSSMRGTVALAMRHKLSTMIEALQPSRDGTRMGGKEHAIIAPVRVGAPERFDLLEVPEAHALRRLCQPPQHDFFKL